LGIDQYETAGGKPVELYEFIVDATTYRYTSSESTVTLVGVNAPDAHPLDGDYVPGVINRDAIAQSDEPSSGEVKLVMERDNDFVQEFSFDRMPDTKVLVRIYRYQRDDVSQEIIAIFDGYVSSPSFTGMQAEFQCTAIQSVLKFQVPVFVVKPTCNNVLFDTMCALDRAPFAVAGTVDEMDVTGTVLTITAAGAYADDYFTIGELVLADGTRRSIIQHAGTTIRLLSGFPEGTVGHADAITLYPGCDGQYATCNTKFANVVNFFGFDLMPVDDPFKVPQT
jgi:uncharacterized phage protein (TIGR02218 family)